MSKQNTKDLTDRQLSIATHYTNSPMWYAVGTTDHVQNLGRNKPIDKPKRHWLVRLLSRRLSKI